MPMEAMNWLDLAQLSFSQSLSILQSYNFTIETYSKLVFQRESRLRTEIVETDSEEFTFVGINILCRTCWDKYQSISFS